MAFLYVFSIIHRVFPGVPLCGIRWCRDLPLELRRLRASPLHLAAKEGHAAVVDLLVEQRADAWLQRGHPGHPTKGSKISGGFLADFWWIFGDFLEKWKNLGGVLEDF